MNVKLELKKLTSIVENKGDKKRSGTKKFDLSPKDICIRLPSACPEAKLFFQVECKHDGLAHYQGGKEWFCWMAGWKKKIIYIFSSLIPIRRIKGTRWLSYVLVNGTRMIGMWGTMWHHVTRRGLLVTVKCDATIPTQWNQRFSPKQRSPATSQSCKEPLNRIRKSFGYF